MNMPPLTFSEILEKALIVWRTNQTKNHASVSINSFSKYLGYSRPMVTQWMNGKRSVTYEAFEKMMPRLHDLIGPEIYNMREHPEPDLVLRYFISSWEELTEAQRSDISGMLDDFLEENKPKTSNRSALSKSIS
jgi:hypothetical protein